MSRTQHPIDLLEEAIHLLRRAPIETYAFFLAGITPFVLSLFSFCSEMSYSELAASNLPVYAFALSLSYCWMKGFQHLACRRLIAVYSGELPDNGKFAAIIRAWFSQAAFHPIGLFAKPMAAIASIPGYLTFIPQLMLPALVTFAFFQNASVVMTGERGDFEKCWRLTASRVRATASLSLLLTLLRVIIFVNVFSTIGVLPYLLKALFGIDTFLSRDFRWLISFTYFVGTCLIAYFAVDLLIKATHVIQVCRAQAQGSGKDLRRALEAATNDNERQRTATAKFGSREPEVSHHRSSLNAFSLICVLSLILPLNSQGSKVAAGSSCGIEDGAGCQISSSPRFDRIPLSCVTLGSAARKLRLLFFYRFAEKSDRLRSDPSDGPFVLVALKRTTPPAESDRIPESELNQQIDRELSGSEYNWRKPQHHLTSPGADWLRNTGAWITRMGHRIGHAVNRIVDTIQKWWKSLFPSPQGSIPSFSGGASAPVWMSQLLVFATIGGLLVVATLIALHLFRRPGLAKAASAVSIVSPMPNLDSESTVADELPEDQWLLLARSKLQEGEPRLALRALFLAVLALLGAQRLIIVRRSKSNSDYESELRRRKQSELTELFRGNRRLFERCWYGDDPVTYLEIEQSNQFYQRLKHACLAEK